MVLEIKNLSKKYSREKYGLQNYSLFLEPGILGLLGPNGAGKSTLLKMIATVSTPTEGSIQLDGDDIVGHPDVMRAQLGYLPQDFGVYPNLNAYEFLNYMAAMKGVGGDNLKKRIELLLEGLNLIENAKRPIGTYSGGMKQRVGIAQALLNDPKVILFDEPTVGLDPQERVRFRNLISELSDDAIVILSSHIVSDIDTIADKVAIMKEGKLLAHDDLHSIIDVVKGKIAVTSMNKEALADFKEKHIVIDTVRKKGEIEVRYVDVDASSEEEVTLEDAYLYLTESN
ncbi:MAG: ABC transporter ATP-binding protein [Bacteroidota bacterium]